MKYTLIGGILSIILLFFCSCEIGDVNTSTTYLTSSEFISKVDVSEEPDISISIDVSSRLPEKEVDTKSLMSAGNITKKNITQYSYDELEAIRKEKNLNLSQFNAKYPVESFRKDFSDYRALYFGDGYVVRVLFDENKEWLTSRWYKFENDSKKLNTIEIGDNLDDVKEADPSGDYSSFELGMYIFPKCSYHYTIDGYRFIFSYTDECEIIGIEKELI